MLDRQKVIQHYINTIPKMTRLPFITDEEMRELFGDEITAILAQLSEYATETGLCDTCQKRCCPVAQCELYNPQFERCPIFDLRPVVCRLHYCHLFQKDRGQMVEELSDIFFECVIAAEAAGIPHTKLFDSPPIVRCAPEFIFEAEKVMQALKKGEISPGEAGRLLYEQATGYRLHIGER